MARLLKKLFGTRAAFLKRQGYLKVSGVFFDNYPIENSENAVTSGGVYKAIQDGGGGGGGGTIDDEVTQNSSNAVKSSGIWTFVKNIQAAVETLIAGKADSSTVSALADDVAANTQAIAGKADSSTVTALADDVAANTTAIAGKADSSTVTDLAADVAGNTASIGTAETAITTLQNTVGVIETKIPSNASPTNKLATTADLTAFGYVGYESGETEIQVSTTDIITANFTFATPLADGLYKCYMTAVRNITQNGIYVKQGGIRGFISVSYLSNSGIERGYEIGYFRPTNGGVTIQCRASSASQPSDIVWVLTALRVA